jgi:hypothetical protein
MAIDDPVGIVIQQTEQESDADNSLSRRLVRLGLSAWAAVALANYRVASNIVTTLLTESPRRFEERIIRLYAPLQPKGYFDAEKRFQMRRSHQGVEGERRSRATRLIGLGLVEEELHVKEDFSFTGSSQQETIKAVAKALATPPARSYKLSRFGWRFLKFITGDEAAATGES